MFWSCSLSGLASVVPVILLSLDQSAVLHALSALVGGHGRGVGGKNNEAADCGPGEKGAQEMLAAGDYVFGEAPTQISVGGHEGGEAESGGGASAKVGDAATIGRACCCRGERPDFFTTVPLGSISSHFGVSAADEGRLERFLDTAYPGPQWLVGLGSRPGWGMEPDGFHGRG